MLGDVEHPDQPNQLVLIIGGSKPGLVGQKGIVTRCESEYIWVRTLVHEQVLKIAMKYLQLLGGQRSGGAGFKREISPQGFGPPPAAPAHMAQPLTPRI
jgi:hypothetical protein